MHSAFEAVVIIVAVVGVGLSFTRLLWPFRAADRVGQVGSSWFSHEEDQPLESRRDPAQNDPPIPQRRLRPRG